MASSVCVARALFWAGRKTVNAKMAPQMSVSSRMAPNGDGNNQEETITPLAFFFAFIIHFSSSGENSCDDWPGFGSSSSSKINAFAMFILLAKFGIFYPTTSRLFSGARICSSIFQAHFGGIGLNAAGQHRHRAQLNNRPLPRRTGEEHHPHAGWPGAKVSLLRAGSGGSCETGSGMKTSGRVAVSGQACGLRRSGISAFKETSRLMLVLNSL